MSEPLAARDASKRGGWRRFTFVLAVAVSLAALPSSLPAQQGGIGPRGPADEEDRDPRRASAGYHDRQEHLASPLERARRERSRTAYSGLSATEARDVVRQTHAHLLNAPGYRPPPGSRSANPLSEHLTQVIDADGHAAVVASLQPTAIRDGSALRPVDLRLTVSDGGWEPRTPVVPAFIGRDARTGVSLGERLRIQLSETPSEGELVDGSVMWENVARDTDLSARATPTGAETFTYLRSESSPERLSYRLEMPAGAEAREQAEGSVTIERDGNLLATVARPAAWDADSTDVPLDMRVEGDDLLVLEIPHRERDLRYPVAVDPSYTWDWRKTTPSPFNDELWKHWTNQPANFSPFWGNAYLGLGAYSRRLTGAEYLRWENGGWAFVAPGAAWITKAVFYPVSFDGPIGTTNSSNACIQSRLYEMTASGTRGAIQSSTDTPERLCNTVADWQTFTSTKSTTSQAKNAAWLYTEMNPAGWHTHHLSYIGGAVFTMSDGDAPSITGQAPQGWQRDDTTPIDFTAHDPSLGIATIRLKTAEKLGWDQALSDSVPCTPMCAQTTAIRKETVPTIGDLPEGITEIVASAADPVGRATLVRAHIELDETVPSSDAAEDTGALADANGGPVAPGPASVSVTFREGTPNGTNAQRRSGVHTIETRLLGPGRPADGEHIKTTPPQEACVESNHGSDNCPMTETYTFPNDPTYPIGQYTVRFKATDHAGNESTRDISFTRADDVDPTVTLSGGATNPIDPGTDLHIRAEDRVGGHDGSGIEEIEVLVDGIRDQLYTTTCPCSAEWELDHQIDPSEYSEGAHTVEVVARDAAGNEGSREVVVYTVDLDLTERDRLGLEDYFHYKSTETGAGARLHVNADTGNVVWHSTPVVNPGRGLSSVVNLTYNSQDRGGRLASALSDASGSAMTLLGAPLDELVGVAYGEVGHGFSLGISGVTRLNEPLAGVQTAGTTGIVRLTDPDGTRHTFTDADRDGRFADPPGLNLRLRRYSDDALKRWAITRPDGVTFFFDADGYATTVEDRHENVLEFEYERVSKVTGAACALSEPAELLCTRRVSRVVDAEGVADATKREERSLRVLYNAGGWISLPSGTTSVPGELTVIGGRAGRISAIVDHADRATEFTYDDDGYLTEISQGVVRADREQSGADDDVSDERTIQLGYEGQGVNRLLDSVTDPRGNTTAVTYDVLPTAPAGEIISADRRIAAITDRRETSWTYDFAARTDAAGTSMTVTDPQRSVESRQDASGRPQVLIDGRDVETRLAWDADNNVETLTEAAGTGDEAVTAMGYGANGAGLLTEQTDAEDRVTTLTYDASAGTHVAPSGLDAGEAFVFDLQRLTPAADNWTEFTLNADNSGEVLHTQVRNQPQTTTEYDEDGHGLITAEHDEIGHVVRYDDFDDSGLPRTRFDERGSVWNYEYDAVGNLLTQTDPRGVATSEVNDDDDFQASFEYDAFDRVTAMTTPRDSGAGTYITRTMSYDANGNLVDEVDGRGGLHHRTYTPMDEVATDEAPASVHHGATLAQREVTSKEYDDVGRLVTETAPNGNGGETGDFETTFEYDDADRLLVTRQHAGDPGADTPAELVTSRSYDARGNVVGVADPRGNAAVAGSDAAANAALAARQRFAYTYDLTNNRLSAVEDPDGLQLRTEFTYDDNENVATEISPRGFAAGATAAQFTKTLAYNDDDLLTSVTLGGERTTQYERRADGLISAITKPKGTASTATNDYRTTYAYYPTGELMQWTLPTAAGQYGPAGRGVIYERNVVGDAETITDPRGNSFENTFFDSGELRTTERPSWWKVDDAESPDPADGESLDPVADAAAIGADLRERPYDEWLRDEGPGELPDTEGQGDFGGVEQQDAPDLLPRAGYTRLTYDGDMRLDLVRVEPQPVDQVDRDDASDATTVTDLTRDAVGRITEESHPIEAGRELVTAYSFDRNGNLREVTDGEGHATTYTYDEYDRRIQESAPGSAATAPTPDATPGTPADRITTMTYDANSNVVDVVTPRGTTHERDYDAVDRLTSWTDPTQARTTYGYDANGNKTLERSPRGNPNPTTENPAPQPDNAFATTFTYNRFDEIATATDGLGNVTSHAYDANGNEVTVTAPGSARDPGGTVAARVTQRDYDARDLLWKETTGSDAQGSTRTTITEFDPNGNLRRVVKPHGIEVTNAAAGPQPIQADTATQEGSPGGAAWTTDAEIGVDATVNVYDADNLRTTEWLPRGAEETDDRTPYRRDFEHDHRGRTTEIVSPYAPQTPDSQAVEFSSRTLYTHYDTNWIASSIDQYFDDDQNQWVNEQAFDYAYDLRGNQTSWTVASSGRQMTRDYYPSGELRERRAIATATDPSPRVYTYGYNDNGSTTQMRSWRRDTTSAPWQTDRETNTRQDGMERITLVDENWTNGRDTQFAWDVNGNLTDRWTDGAANTTVQPVTYSNGKHAQFQFDALDRETSMSVTQDWRAGTRTTTTTYWPSGDPATRTKTNGTVEDWGYNDDGTAHRMRRRARDAVAEFAKDQTYAYDVNGNRTSDERGIHSYNARDQLVQWVDPGEAGTEDDYNVLYEHNGSGALSAKTEGGVRTVFGMLGDRVTAEVSDDPTSNRAYSYDDLGNVTRIDGGADDLQTFKFDEFGRMVEGTSTEVDPLGQLHHTFERFTYDPLDRRDFKCIGATDDQCTGGERFDMSYVGLSDHLARERLSETDEGRIATYDYSSAGEPLAQERMFEAFPNLGIVRPFAKDALGSVEGLEDQNGRIKGAADPDQEDPGDDGYDFDPFGQVRNRWDESDVARSNPIRFEGFYYDSGLRTYDMKARPYMPAIGRFLTADRFESASGDINLQSDHLSQNRYAFAGGNPVNNVEWDGHRRRPPPRRWPRPWYWNRNRGRPGVRPPDVVTRRVVQHYPQYARAELGGLDSHGRASYFSIRIHNPMEFWRYSQAASRDTRRLPDPKGWTSRSGSHFDRSHLGPQLLGVMTRDRRNITKLPWRFNQETMTKYERRLAKALGGRGAVFYEVRAIYKGRETVPTRLIIRGRAYRNGRWVNIFKGLPRSVSVPRHTGPRSRKKH